MPNNFIKKIAKQSGESKGKLENTYKKIENNAKKEGYSNTVANKIAVSTIEKSKGKK